MAIMNQHSPPTSIVISKITKCLRKVQTKHRYIEVCISKISLDLRKLDKKSDYPTLSKNTTIIKEPDNPLKVTPPEDNIEDSSLQDPKKDTYLHKTVALHKHDYPTVGQSSQVF